MYFSSRLFLHTVFLLEGDAPFEEQAQAGTHGVASGLLHDEAALGDGLELICRQQGALHHLQALAGIVFPAAHGAGEHRARALEKASAASLLGAKPPQITSWQLSIRMEAPSFP